ncbi:hypothetical protein I6F14_23305 [Bradyrhizobium sp. IC3069]|nr:hypothetical protein [Bradyrhizobium sp. IC4059]MCA1520898.1 hypothetical protein [Bradyrhizobium sp. IC3069]
MKGNSGKPALNETPVIKTLVGLPNLIVDADGRIDSTDVNPFLLSTKNGVAVDALVVLRNATTKSADTTN